MGPTIRSEKDVKVTELISGQTGSDYADVPSGEPGFDSYWVQRPKPSASFGTIAGAGISRFAGALPVKKIARTLGEGDTPLTPSQKFEGIYIKNEALNPTGSFKDRESAVALALAEEKGWNDLSIVSSGNAALSAALYARIYGYRMTCYVPTVTSRHKLGMIELFGARTHMIGDTYEETYHYALDNLPKGSVNITSGVFPQRVEGFKTIAYEIWQQLGEVPKAVICPAGNGSALAGIYQGFEELKRWGMTASVPAMICVQVSDADPINKAFQNNTWIERLSEVPESQAEAIVAMESYCSPKAVYALRQSGGRCYSVEDHQAIDALRYAVDQEGVFPEFSSASAFAALLDNFDEITALGTPIVVINSGSGLKEIQDLRETLNGSTSGVRG